MNGKYPGAVVADSGYGIEINYSFMKDNGIKAFVKFQSWEGDAKGERPQLFFLDSITCLNGKKAEPIQSESRHVRRKGNLQYLVDGCMDCEFAYRCRKSLKYKNDGKRFVELNPSYERLKDEARNDDANIKLINIANVKLTTFICVSAKVNMYNFTGVKMYNRLP